MKKENWLPVNENEERYEISNWGRVKSLARIIEAKDGSTRYYPERILEPKPNKSRGYVAVRLYDDQGNYQHIEVHRLVALHFLENLDGLPLINHIDTIRHNNHVDNLEWCSYSKNLRHRGASKKSGEKRKKKVYQYSLDNEFLRAYTSATDAALEGYNRSGICNVCNGNRPHYKGFIWRYE